jgi:hypothetical protein
MHAHIVPHRIFDRHRNCRVRMDMLDYQRNRVDRGLAGVAGSQDGIFRGGTVDTTGAGGIRWEWLEEG